MRKFMWFTIGFAAACAVGAYWVSGIWLLLLAAACIVLLIFGALMLQGRKNSVLLVLFGCVVAFFWVWGNDIFSLREAKALHGQKIEAQIEITDFSEATNYGIAAEGTILLEDEEYPIRVYSYVLELLTPGSQLYGEVSLQYTGNGERTNYYYSLGIPLVGYLGENTVVETPERIPAKFAIAVLRQKLLTLLGDTFPDDTLGFARALLFGDTSLLNYEQETQLSISGIRHIAAVSGLHISILFSMVYTVVGYRRVLTPAVGLPLLLLFAALAGFTPSVTRACIMQALMILALLFDREYDPPTALAFAVLVMLLAEPAIITAVGFQLSVGCVIGILLFGKKIRGFLLRKQKPSKKLRYRLTSWAASSISITLSTMIIVTPLCAVYFGMVSLISWLTNLLTLWVMPCLLLGILLTCVLGAIWLPLGKAVAWVTAWPMRYVLGTARVLSPIPHAAVYTESIYIVLWLFFCYVLLLVFRFGKQKQPMMLLVCMIVGLGVALTASWLEARQDDYRMTVLDVGQGQCILLQVEDKHYMIDCGGYNEEGVADLAAQTLLSQGIFHLDGVILTHYDTDHAGGVENFLTRVSAENLYLPAAEDNSTIKESLVRTYNDSICWISDTLTLNKGMLQLFADGAGKSDNESGLCILCRFKNCDILITGDRSIEGEKALLAQTVLPDLEILIAGHHGSGDSTGKELLAAAKPELTIISVGENNSYGHPAQMVLDRLKEIGSQVLRTDQNGTIIIRG